MKRSCFCRHICCLYGPAFPVLELWSTTICYTSLVHIPVLRGVFRPPAGLFFELVWRLPKDTTHESKGKVSNSQERNPVTWICCDAVSKIYFLFRRGISAYQRQDLPTNFACLICYATHPRTMNIEVQQKLNLFVNLKWSPFRFYTSLWATLYLIPKFISFYACTLFWKLSLRVSNFSRRSEKSIISGFVPHSSKFVSRRVKVYRFFVNKGTSFGHHSSNFSLRMHILWKRIRKRNFSGLGVFA